MNLAARLMGVVKSGKAKDLNAPGGPQVIPVNLNKMAADAEAAARERPLRRQGCHSVQGIYPQFTARILCTEEVVHDSEAHEELRFQKLFDSDPREHLLIPLKGFPNRMQVSIIGLCREDVQEDQQDNFDPTGYEARCDEVADAKDAEFTIDEVHDEASEKIQWQLETPLTYSQYFCIVSSVQSTLGPEARDASDIVWIRSGGGHPLSIGELVGIVPQHQFDHGKATTSDPSAHNSALIQQLATVVPAETNHRVTAMIHTLAPLSQLIMKVLAVLGGHSEIELLRHLLTHVKFIAAHYTRLCNSFERTRKEHLRRSRLELSLETDTESDTLAVVMRDLVSNNMIEIDAATTEMRCNEFLIVDALYQSLAFQHRREIHYRASCWLHERDEHEHTTLQEEFAEQRCSRLFLIIHHTMLSEDDASALALLRKAMPLGQTSFIERFVTESVSLYLETRDGPMTYDRARRAMQAIPFLRGLAKALQQQSVTNTLTRTQKTLMTKLMRSRSRTMQSQGDMES
jgi:hypothetical protein